MNCHFSREANLASLYHSQSVCCLNYFYSSDGDPDCQNLNM